MWQLQLWSLTASEPTMRWCPDHPHEHWILHASEIKPRTWENCVRFKVLHLTKLQAAHGLYLTFYGRLHVFQTLGGHPRQLRHMLKGIGPDTRLWVFVSGKWSIAGNGRPSREYPPRRYLVALHRTGTILQIRRRHRGHRGSLQGLDWQVPPHGLCA